MLREPPLALVWVVFAHAGSPSRAELIVPLLMHETDELAHVLKREVYSEDVALMKVPAAVRKVWHIGQHDVLVACHT